jgi:hypothetical protein
MKKKFHLLSLFLKHSEPTYILYKINALLKIKTKFVTNTPTLRMKYNIFNG